MSVNHAAKELYVWYKELSAATNAVVLNCSDDPQVNEMTRQNCASHYASELVLGQLPHDARVFTPLMLTLVALELQEQLVVSERSWKGAVCGYCRSTRQLPELEKAGLLLPAPLEFWYSEFIIALKYGGAVQGYSTAFTPGSRKLSLRNAFAMGTRYLCSVGHAYHTKHKQLKEGSSVAEQKLYWIGALVASVEQSADVTATE